MNTKRVIITGPTAVGKTSVSLLVAEELGTSIISADSRQSYRYLNIGTSKPEAHQLCRVPHFNISIIDPKQSDNVHSFVERAHSWENSVLKNNPSVVYCGGSTLYVQSLFQPLDPIPQSNPHEIRKLNQRADESGLESLFDELKQVDPDYAQQMDGLNRQRIIRALEVYYQTGKPFSSFHSGHEKPEPNDDSMIFVLNRDRADLHTRIEQRTQKMLKKGLLKEVSSLLSLGYHSSDPGLNSVGYKETLAYIRNELTKEDMVSLINRNTRRYAKRQITWFRRWNNVAWIDVTDLQPEEVANHICKRLAAYGHIS